MCGGSGAASSVSCTDGSIENQFVRDLEQVPAWARGNDEADAAADDPGRDVRRVAAALAADPQRGSIQGDLRVVAGERGAGLDGGQGSRQGRSTSAWPSTSTTSSRRPGAPDDGIDDERRESIVNKTAISATTNRTIGGAAPSAYLAAIEKRAQISSDKLNSLLAGSSRSLAAASTRRLRRVSSCVRRELLCELVEAAMGKAVPRDVDDGAAQESSADFDLDMIAEPVGQEN